MPYFFIYFCFFIMGRRGRRPLQWVGAFSSLYRHNIVASVFFCLLSFSKENGGSKTCALRWIGEYASFYHSNIVTSVFFCLLFFFKRERREQAPALRKIGEFATFYRCNNVGSVFFCLLFFFKRKVGIKNKNSLKLKLSLIWAIILAEDLK